MSKNSSTILKMQETIQKFILYMENVENLNDFNYVLLRNKNVISWIFGDTSFLGEIDKKNKTNDIKTYKLLEDNWGRAIMKSIRPDLKSDKQWTTIVGQEIGKELYTLLGHTVSYPIKKEHYQPDWEVDNCIIEVKTQTFYTTGTAGEKILGSPFKYSEIPELYGKPLKILCIGGAEKICKEQYGNLPGIKCTPSKEKFLNFFRENKIEYIGVTEVLTKLNS